MMEIRIITSLREEGMIVMRRIAATAKANLKKEGQHHAFLLIFFALACSGDLNFGYSENEQSEKLIVTQPVKSQPMIRIITAIHTWTNKQTQHKPL